MEVCCGLRWLEIGYAKMRVVCERPSRRLKVVDKHCIGRWCLKTHKVAVHGHTSSGRKVSGYVSDECAYRYKHGCPDKFPKYDLALAQIRKEEGWCVHSYGNEVEDAVLERAGR